VAIRGHSASSVKSGQSAAAHLPTSPTHRVVRTTSPKRKDGCRSRRVQSSHDPPTSQHHEGPSCYRGADIPMRVIRRFARQSPRVPTPKDHSLRLSCLTGGPRRQRCGYSRGDAGAVSAHAAVRIRWAVPAPFPMDLIVRTAEKPAVAARRRRIVHTEIVTKRARFCMRKGSRIGCESRGHSRRPRLASAPGRFMIWSHSIGAEI